MTRVADLQRVRRQKRNRTGWTMAEIRESAAKRAAANRELERDEPANLASGGDMAAILDDNENDED